jgi:TerC family integral membrane protein
MISPTQSWILFSIFTAVALAADLFVFHRRSHVIRLKEALIGSICWISLGLLFNLLIYVGQGPRPALEFLTGYLIELSLSVDNLFVFMLLFRYFHVPPPYQHRVLFWGILGAVVMRLGFILAGVTLIDRFHWAIYVFGGILIYSGINMARQKEVEVHPDRNPVLKLFRRFMPMTSDYDGDHFFVRRLGRVLATPLFLVLWMINVTDLVFAVDSIPAVLAITTDPFIVFSSNIFAILGLRALFFTLEGAMRLFHRLHHGLSLILVFVGVKMVISDLIHVPTWLALAVVLSILLVSVVASIARPRLAAPGPKEEDQPPAENEPETRTPRAADRPRTFDAP